MRFWMRVAAPFVAVMGITTAAKAQMWGVGMYGGMQACQYPYGAAAGASSVSDEVREAESAIREAQRQLNSKRTEKRRADRDAERARRDIEDTISMEYADFIFAHIENTRGCMEYQGSATRVPQSVSELFVSRPSRMPADAPAPEEESAVSGTEGGQAIATGGTFPTAPFDMGQWGQYCQNGGVSGAICQNSRYRAQDGRGSTTVCQNGLVEYKRAYGRVSKLQREIDDLERLIERAQDDKSDAIQDAADRRREQLEAGYCETCGTTGYSYQRPETDWGSVVGNIGLGLAATYMGYKQNESVANYNASIGWPTQAYPSWGYGMPFFAQGVQQALGGGSGIYGAMSGGIGAGAFGCAGNNGGPYGMMGPMGGMNGNGMWGNPYGMMGMGGQFGGMGGGMYMPGMGPWGMAGPYGSGGPFGPGGAVMGGMIGMAGMGGPMMGGYMGNMMGGMGNMMGGYMGMPMGAMAGGMMGMPMGGYMGAMGGGMMGMPMGGYMGGMGNMMGAMGGGMMGAMMGGSDMQMQMMQMQMQMYQQYVQQQQSYVQQQMQRQQTVMALQQELQGLLYRIQAVQYGGTSYLGSSFGVTTGISTGTSGLTPINSGTGIIPVGTATGTAPVPSTR